MPAPGTMLGSYRILAKLGEGGMGEVYQARDTKLNRDTAIKILPAAFASDPDRRARFEREALTLASLNHPHIAQIYGVIDVPPEGAGSGIPPEGGSDRAGTTALVMEFANGEDLSARLARGAIPIDDALAVARQIASALAAAHEIGIVHRDLKPANVKVRADGVVKVLDFGLAKALGPGAEGQPAADAANSPTLTVRGTRMGMIVGTAAYMSPEQARGKTVDRRADVWAFGVVLFEMLTGRRAFTGDDVSDVIASVLRDAVPFERLPAGTPDAIRRLLRRCLEKDRGKRLDSMSTARLEIDEALSDPVTFRPRSQLPVDLPSLPLAGSRLPAPGPQLPAAAPRPAADDSQRPLAGVELPAGVFHLPAPGSTPATGAPSAPKPNAPFARNTPWLFALLVAVAAWLAVARPWRTYEPPASLRLAIDPGFDGSLVTDLMTEIAFSPDGRTIAFSGRGRNGGRSHLYVRRLDQLEASMLQGTEDAAHPFFAPDGQSIGFFMPGKLCRMSIGGGAIAVLADVQIARGATWGDDGVITFAPEAIPNGPLRRVAASGGSVTALGPMAAGHITQRWPQAIPGSRTLLYTGSPSVDTFEDACLVAQEPGAAPKIVQCGGYAWRYGAGHVLYVRGGTLFAAPFDLPRLTLTGPSVAVVSHVRSAPVSGAAQFAISTGGLLAYVPGHADAALTPVQLVGRDGKGPALAGVPAGWQSIVFSPDGKQLALDSTAPNAGIWLYDVDRSAPTRLTLSNGDSTPVWSPDGRRVAYSSTAAGPANLWAIAADGSGQRQRLAESPFLQVPDSWAPDGRTLLYSQGTAHNQFDLWLLPIEADGAGIKGGTPRPFVATRANEGFATFSPDGRWIAYTSDESGTYQVYVRAASGSGARYQVSATNGMWPQWARAKSELFFGALDNSVMFVTWSADEGVFRSSRPEAWTPSRYDARSTFSPFTLHPDGARLAMSVEASPSPAATLVVVTNFADAASAKTRRGP